MVVPTECFVQVLVMGSAVQAGEPALAELGLGGLQVISEKEGMEVRGLAAESFASGTTSVRGMLTADTGNFFSFDTLWFGRSNDTDSSATESNAASTQAWHPVQVSAQSLSTSFPNSYASSWDAFTLLGGSWSAGNLFTMVPFAP